MQILFGAHETIIKINSKSMNIEYIQHYITTHFKSRTISANNIKIPTSTANLYHRTFLLKWFYALYAKKNGPLPELKESLIQRYYKAIKVVLPQKIVHTLHYKVINANTLHLTITPQNVKIALKVKNFLQIPIKTSATYLELNIETQNEKKRLQEFLQTNEIISVPHKHIFNKWEINRFLHATSEEEKSNENRTSPLANAYMILQMNPTNDVKSIKKQYKNLAKKLHPDRVKEQDEELIALHTKKFQELLECYEIILTEQKGLMHSPM